MLCYHCNEEEATRANDTFCDTCCEQPESWDPTDESLVARLGASEVDGWREAALRAGDHETAIALGVDCQCSCGCENQAIRWEDHGGNLLCEDCLDYAVWPAEHPRAGEVVCAWASSEWELCPWCVQDIKQRGTSGPSVCGCCVWTFQPDGVHVALLLDDDDDEEGEEAR